MSEEEILVKEAKNILERKIDWLTVMITEYNKLLQSYMRSRNRLVVELKETEKELSQVKKNE